MSPLDETITLLILPIAAYGKQQHLDATDTGANQGEGAYGYSHSDDGEGIEGGQALNGHVQELMHRGYTRQQAEAMLNRELNINSHHMNMNPIVDPFEESNPLRRGGSPKSHSSYTPPLLPYARAPLYGDPPYEGTGNDHYSLSNEGYRGLYGDQMRSTRGYGQIYPPPIYPPPDSDDAMALDIGESDIAALMHNGYSRAQAINLLAGERGIYTRGGGRTMIRSLGVSSSSSGNEMGGYRGVGQSIPSEENTYHVDNTVLFFDGNSYSGDPFNVNTAIDRGGMSERGDHLSRTASMSQRERDRDRERNLYSGAHDRALAPQARTSRDPVVEEEDIVELLRQGFTRPQAIEVLKAKFDASVIPGPIPFPSRSPRMSADRDSIHSTQYYTAQELNDQLDGFVELDEDYESVRVWQGSDMLTPLSSTCYLPCYLLLAYLVILQLGRESCRGNSFWQIPL